VNLASTMIVAGVRAAAVSGRAGQTGIPVERAVAGAAA